MLKLSGLLALLALPVSALGGPEAAEQAYQAARARYYALKRDTTQRKFRHNWLRVAQGFERVAATHSQSHRALTQNPKGDRIAEIRSLLKALDRESSEKSHRGRSAPQPKMAAINSPRQAPVDWKIKAFSAAALSRPEPSVQPKRLPIRGSSSAELEPKPATITLKLDTGAASAAVETSTPPRDGSEEQNAAPRSQVVETKAVVQRLRPLRERSAYTLSEQLGLKVRRVVVDAGHGGHDTG